MLIAVYFNAMGWLSSNLADFVGHNVGNPPCVGSCELVDSGLNLPTVSRAALKTDTGRLAKSIMHLRNETQVRRKPLATLFDKMSLVTLAEFIGQATFLTDVEGCLITFHGWQFAPGFVQESPTSGERLTSFFCESIATSIAELLEDCDGTIGKVVSRVISEPADDCNVYRLTMTAPTETQRILTIRDVTCDELACQLRQRQRQAAERVAALTERENQVMRLVIQGLPNKAIASRLQLSIKTIEKYRSSIMRKLELRSLCDLLRFWFRLAWVEELDAA